MALPFKILSQEPFTAITIEQAKDQCRIMASNTIDDTYISGLILDAAHIAQEYLHWVVSEAQLKQYSRIVGEIQLYGKYVISIDNVSASDGSGNVVELTTDEYSFNDVTEILTVKGAYIDVYITYTCGNPPNGLPLNVTRGILMLISTMYNNREDFVAGLTVEKMPMCSIDLLSLSRNYVS